MTSRAKGYRMHMSEPQSEGQVSETQSLEGAAEPISPGDATAGSPDEGLDVGEAGPDAVPEGNREANETTDDAG